MPAELRANLLLNGDFESATPAEYWVLSDRADVVHRLVNETPPKVYDGQTGLGLFAAPGYSRIYAEQSVAAAPDSNWTFSGHMLNSVNNKLGSGSYGLAQMEFKGGNGESLGIVDSGKLVQLTGPWTDFSISGVAPAGTVSVVFRPTLMLGSDTSGVLYVDGLLAEVTPVPEVWVPAIATGFLGAVVVVSNARRKQKRPDE